MRDTTSTKIPALLKSVAKLLSSNRAGFPPPDTRGPLAASPAPYHPMGPLSHKTSCACAHRDFALEGFTPRDETALAVA